jgi:hypothetical protein
MSVESTAQLFAQVIRKSEYVPHTADISIEAAGILEDATAIRCSWPIDVKKSTSGNRSREIIVQVSSKAISAFEQADAQTRSAMADRILHLLNSRLQEARYSEDGPSSPAFVIPIYEYALTGRAGTS